MVIVSTVGTVTVLLGFHRTLHSCNRHEIVSNPFVIYAVRCQASNWPSNFPIIIGK